MNLKVLTFIPAGGLGTRLAPLTNWQPKPLILANNNYQGKSARILDYVLLAAEKISDYIVVSHWFLGHQIHQYLKDHYPSCISLQDNRLINIGGSLLYHRRVIEELPIDIVLVAPGDHFLSESVFERGLVVLKETQCDVAIIATSHLDGHEVYKIDRQGRFIGTSSESVSSQSELVGSLGIYFMRKKWILDRLQTLEYRKSGYYDLTSDIVFGTSIQKNNITFVSLTANDYWGDLGTIESLYDHLIQYGQRDQENNVLFNGAFISSNATARDCVLYPGCKLGQGISLSRCIVDENIVLDQSTFNGAKFGKLFNCRETRTGIKVYSRNLPSI